MINLIELQVRNIFSYGNNITKIPLNFKDPTLIIGENHDVMIDGEFDNNGAGKSSILNALAYCGYGKPVSPGIKVDDLINNINKKNLYTALLLEKDKTYYKIERWRKNSKLGGTGNNGVKIISADTIEGLDNPENEKTPAGRTADEYIAEAILGMPFEVFVRIVVFSATYEAFLSLPVTHTTKTSQTSILEELFGQKELTEKAVKLKEIIKNTSDDIKQLSQFNERIEAEAVRYREQLKLAEASIVNWDTEHTNQIHKLKMDIERLEKIDFKKHLESIEQLDSLRSQMKDLTVQRDKIEQKISIARSSKISYDEWNTSNQSQIESTLNLLSPYKEIDFDLQLKALDEIKSLKVEYDKQVSTQTELNAKIRTIIDDIKKLDGEIKLLNESTCPYCKQEFHDKTKLEDENNKLNKLAEMYSSLHEDVEKSKSVANSIMEKIDSIDCLYDNMIDYTQSKNSYTNLQEKLNTLKSAKNPFDNSEIDESQMSDWLSSIQDYDTKLKGYKEQIDRITKDVGDTYTSEFLYSEQAKLNELRNRLVEKINEPNPHNDTVDRLRKVFDGLDNAKVDELDELKVLLEHQNFLLKLLTKKDSFIRQALLDANLPLLNTQLRYYLDIIGLPHKVEFTKDMTISISQFGNQIGYANLSGGQKARINIAIAFSFRDVVQARHEKINFYILDECLDTGLSNLGVKLAAKMIKRVAKENDLSMYIITHRDEIKASFDKKLKAVLKGGLTTLEFN